MRLAGAALAVVVCLTAATAAAAPGARRGCPPLRAPRPTPAGQQRLFGRVVSLRRSGARYVLVFRPGWLLTGYAAEQWALAHTGSRDVPNDSIAVDGTQRFTFLVQASAKVTLLGAQGQPCAIPSSVATLAAHLATHRRRFWIRVASTYPNAVVALDEQYQP